MKPGISVETLDVCVYCKLLKILRTQLRTFKNEIWFFIHTYTYSSRKIFLWESNYIRVIIWLERIQIHYTNLIYLKSYRKQSAQLRSQALDMTVPKSN